MKKMIIFLLCAFALLWILTTGFSVRKDVYIEDFTVSADGTQLQFTVGISSSAGYVRTYTDEGGGVKPHQLKFYCAWGGFNSPIGARSRFVMSLDPEDTEIYIYRGFSSYELVLVKDAVTGQWQRPAEEGK